MPWTESIWTFDHFLRGGQDLEFSLIALASSICLALVISLQANTCVGLLLTIRRWPSDLIRSPRLSPPSGIHRLSVIPYLNSWCPIALSLCDLPMRI